MIGNRNAFAGKVQCTAVVAADVEGAKVFVVDVEVVHRGLLGRLTCALADSAVSESM